MKRPFYLLIFLAILLLVACGSEEPTATTAAPTLAIPADAQATPTLASLASATTAVTDAPTLTATATWTSVPVIPTRTQPPPPVNTRFHNLRFAANPGAAPQVVYPVGTGEVFAVWEYSGMNQGDLVQRAWRYNGSNWLNREEVWNLAARGASGTVTDVSVFDKAIGGLTPGDYQLDLFVNGVWQSGGSFTILPRPTDGQPNFSNLYFAANPNAPAQTSFPAGIEQVYAIWNYSNMGVSDVVKRQWAWNGPVWLEREETWDYFHYGPDGVVTDVSIFDFDGGGLQSGSYTMAVYLNGVKQLEGAFTIGEGGPNENVTLQQSTETRIAKVLDGKKLVVDEWDGSRRELATGLEIVDLQWFWDGAHLLYVDRDTSQRIGNSTLGIKHALFLVNADTGQVTQLGSFAEDFHDPQPSQSLRHIALLSGTNYGDACGVDRRLFFMELDDSWQRTAVYEMGDFAGAPVSDQYLTFPPYKGKLNWLSPYTYQASIDATCIDIDTAPPEDLLLRGVYQFDMNTLTAVRIGDLP